MKKFLLLLLLGTLVTGCTQTNVQNPTHTITPIAKTVPITVTQTVITPTLSQTKETISVQENESAIDVIARTHTVKLKHFSFGDTVDSIDDIVGGTDGRYWIFYINGKMSDIGAGEYKLKNGDQIIWKFLKEGESL